MYVEEVKTYPRIAFHAAAQSSDPKTLEKFLKIVDDNDTRPVFVFTGSDYIHFTKAVDDLEIKPFLRETFNMTSVQHVVDALRVSRRDRDFVMLTPCENMAERAGRAGFKVVSLNQPEETVRTQVAAIFASYPS